MPIQAVVRGIDLAADKPPSPWRIPFQNFFPWLEPLQLLGGFRPKRLGILARELRMLALFAWADFLNSFGGGKFLLSSNKTSIALSAMVQPPRNIIYSSTGKRHGFYLSLTGFARGVCRSLEKHRVFECCATRNPTSEVLAWLTPNRVLG
jgi:hypothetical protein